MASNDGKGGAVLVNAGTQAVLRVLEKKAFFSHRFSEQVRALFKSEAAGNLPGLPASLYLASLLARLPDDILTKAADLAARAIVNDFSECPTPAEVRVVIAESAIAAMGVTFPALAERARLFVAQPPSRQEVANRWLERVLYTTVLRMGRDRFISISAADWRREICATLLTEADTLRTYQVPEAKPVKPVRRDFKSLLPNHG